MVDIFNLLIFFWLWLFNLIKVIYKNKFRIKIKNTKNCLLTPEIKKFIDVLKLTI